MADDYQELPGRSVEWERGKRRIVRTIGIATLETDGLAPGPVKALTGTTYTTAPIYPTRKTAEQRYPGRITFLAIWESPVTRAEFLAGTG